MAEIVNALQTALLQTQRRPDMDQGARRRPAGKRLVQFYASAEPRKRKPDLQTFNPGHRVTPDNRRAVAVQVARMGRV